MIRLLDYDEDIGYPVYEADFSAEDICTTVTVNEPIPEFVIDNGKFALHLRIRQEDIADIMSLCEIAKDWYEGKYL